MKSYERIKGNRLSEKAERNHKEYKEKIPNLIKTAGGITITAIGLQALGTIMKK